MNSTLTALEGVKVGHATHIDKLTGCTVILFDKPCPVAYKSYGGFAGTFNTDGLNSGSSAPYRYGLFISGGSSAGLTSGGAIMQAMIQDGTGDKIYKIVNPLISGAIVMDLGIKVGQYDPRFAVEAYHNANTDPVQSGNVGAGTGTSVGKFHYLNKGIALGAMKAGVGSARINLGKGVIVTALSVVNAMGNIIDYDGSVLAGNRSSDKKFAVFGDTTQNLTNTSNTTITIVGMNLDLKFRENYERVAHLATHGQVRAIHPVNTSQDGDTVFVFSTERTNELLNTNGKQFEADWPKLSVDIVGNAAAYVTQESIYDACRKAETIPLNDAYLGVIPSTKDYLR